MAFPRKTVICDNGSSSLKVVVNLQEEEEGERSFPNIVGRVNPGHAWLSGDYFFGQQAIEYKDISVMVKPIVRGRISFPEMERMWDHTFTNLLRIDPSEHDLIITEAANSRINDTDRMVQIMLEGHMFRSVLVARTPVLSAYAANRLTCVSVDIGADLTQVIPIADGRAQNLGILVEDVGGSDITEFLMQISGRPELNNRERFSNFNRLKEDCGYVAPYRYGTSKRHAKDEVYTLPDGVRVTLGRQMCKCAEFLFKPHERRGNGIPLLVHRSVSALDDEGLENTLRRKIVLGGGSTLFQGMFARVEKEMEEMYSGDGTVKVYDAGGPTSAVVGGRMLSFSPSILEGHLTTMKEYQENPDVVLERRV